MSALRGRTRDGIECLLCHGQMQRWLSIPPRRGIAESRPYSLYWCAVCRFGRIDPMPSWNELAQHYGSYYTHGPHDTGKARRSMMERLRVHLAWRVDRGEPLNAAAIRRWLPAGDAAVCDIGCGDGKLLRDLLSENVSVVGIEPDPVARSVAPAGVSVLEGSAECLPSSLPRGAYDAVVVSHVLEHCASPATALRNIYSLLKPGGTALITVPNNNSEGLRYSGPAWRWLDVPRHVNFFTSRSLSTLCNAAGLSVVEVEYDGYCRQFTDKWAGEELRISEEFGLSRRLPRWPLLLRTFFSSPERKYDTVRIIGRKALPGLRGAHASVRDFPGRPSLPIHAVAHEGSLDRRLADGPR